MSSYKKGRAHFVIIYQMCDHTVCKNLLLELLRFTGRVLLFPLAFLGWDLSNFCFAVNPLVIRPFFPFS